MTKDSICVITLSDTESELDCNESIDYKDQVDHKIKDGINMNKNDNDTITLDESADIVVLDDSSVVESTLPFKIDKTGSSTLPEFIPIYTHSRSQRKRRKKSLPRLRKLTREQWLKETSTDDTSVEIVDESISIELDRAVNSRLTQTDSGVELITITESNDSSAGTKNTFRHFKKAVKKLTKPGQSIQNGQKEVQNASIMAKKKLKIPCVKINKKEWEQLKAPKNKIIHLTQSNALIPEKNCTKGLRPIIIDGLNVAHGFGLGEFSFKGIIIVVQYFESRGHDEIVCFLPHHYQGKIESNSEMETIKKRFEKNRILTYTPSRVINGKRISPYDDRYIIQYATERKGVIITNDSYKDLLMEANWKETIEQRIINFTFTRGGGLMLPRDPLGFDGPTLDEILRFPDS